MIKWINFHSDGKSEIAELLAYLSLDVMNLANFENVDVSGTEGRVNILFDEISKVLKQDDILLAYPPGIDKTNYLFCMYNFRTRSWYQIHMENDGLGDDERLCLKDGCIVVMREHGNIVTLFNFLIREQ